MLKNKNEGVKKVRIYDRKGEEIDTSKVAVPSSSVTKSNAKDMDDIPLAE